MGVQARCGVKRGSGNCTADGGRDAEVRGEGDVVAGGALGGIFGLQAESVGVGAGRKEREGRGWEKDDQEKERGRDGMRKGNVRHSSKHYCLSNTRLCRRDLGGFRQPCTPKKKWGRRRMRRMRREGEGRPLTSLRTAHLIRPHAPVLPAVELGRALDVVLVRRHDVGALTAEEGVRGG